MCRRHFSPPTDGLRQRRKLLIHLLLLVVKLVNQQRSLPKSVQTLASKPASLLSHLPNNSLEPTHSCATDAANNDAGRVPQRISVFVLEFRPDLITKYLLFLGGAVICIPEYNNSFVVVSVPHHMSAGTFFNMDEGISDLLLLLL